jgi:hypothetical protein
MPNRPSDRTCFRIHLIHTLQRYESENKGERFASSGRFRPLQPRGGNQKQKSPFKANFGVALETAISELAKRTFSPDFKKLKKADEGESLPEWRSCGTDIGSS